MRLTRDPSWWGTFVFYEGVLQELSEDLDTLPNTYKPDVLRSVRKSKELLAGIEKRLEEEKAPF